MSSAEGRQQTSIGASAFKRCLDELVVVSVHGTKKVVATVPVSSGKGDSKQQDAKSASIVSRDLGEGGSSSKQPQLETKEQAPAPITAYKSLGFRFDAQEGDTTNIAGLWKVRHVGCNNSPSTAEFIYSGAPAEVDKEAIVQRLQADHS